MRSSLNLFRLRNLKAASLPIGGAALTVALVIKAHAVEPKAIAKPDAKPDKAYTGIVTFVDPKEHALYVKRLLKSQRFNFGDDCVFKLLDSDESTVNNLRPGQKVTVNYQNANGVMVADCVEQRPLQHEGVVRSIDPQQHRLTLGYQAFTATLTIPDDCKIVLRENKPGTLADIKPGHHVTVLFEEPPGRPIARQIAQTSATFTGTLTAIDVSDRTVKAKSVFSGSKKFILADSCVIVLNGKTVGQLRNLKPDDKLTFSYDEVNGVNIVNRIGYAEGAEEAVTAQSFR
jgi:Cu/Ag efflux protein CusF